MDGGLQIRQVLNWRSTTLALMRAQTSCMGLRSGLRRGKGKTSTPLAASQALVWLEVWLVSPSWYKKVYPLSLYLESIFLETLLEQHNLMPIWVNAGQSWGGKDKITGLWNGAVGLVRQIHGIPFFKTNSN